MSSAHSEIPVPHPLENKPLVEVIFELRWKLEEGRQPGLRSDPGFKILMGRYYDRIRHQYPHVEDLPASKVPEDISAHAVRHQFWKAKGAWPVTQIGPGILTVNETEEYMWDTYRPRLIDSIKALHESYPTEIAKLQPIQVTLKYIDALDFDPAKSKRPLLRFLREYLHTAVEIDPLLFSPHEEAESPLGLNLNLTYPLEKPKGVVVLTVGTGTKSGRPAVLWDTTVISKGDQVPNELGQFGVWLDDAHTITDRWFFTLTRGQLLESFEARSHANSDVQLRS